MIKQIIGQRQFSWLLVVFIITPALINLPEQLVLIAGSDAIFTQMVPAIYTLVIGFVFYKLSVWFPGKNLFEINIAVAGKWGGGIVNGLFLAHIFLVFCRDFRILSGFIKTSLLPRTPEEILIMLAVLVLIYYGRTSVEVAARVNELFFPLLVMILLILPLLLANDFTLFQRDPVLIHSALQLGTDSLLGTSWYGDAVIFGAFLNVIGNYKQLHAAFRHGIMLAAFLLTYLLAVCIYVLGPGITAKEYYPTYALFRQVHITDFLDRVDLAMFSIYFPSYFINIVLSYIALLIGITSYVKDKDYTRYSRALGWLMVLVLYFAFSGTTDAIQFGNFGLPLFVLAIQPPYLIAAYFLARYRHKKKGSASTSGGESGRETSGASQQASSAVDPARPSPSSPGDSQTQKKEPPTRGWKRMPIPLRIWMRLTHIFLAAGVIFLGLGIWLGLNYQKFAVFCASAYLLCLVLTVITTYMEMKRTATEKKGFF